MPLDAPKRMGAKGFLGLKPHRDHPTALCQAPPRPDHQCSPVPQWEPLCDHPVHCHGLLLSLHVPTEPNCPVTPLQAWAMVGSPEAFHSPGWSRCEMPKILWHIRGSFKRAGKGCRLRQGDRLIANRLRMRGTPDESKPEENVWKIRR